MLFHAEGERRLGDERSSPTTRGLARAQSPLGPRSEASMRSASQPSTKNGLQSGLRDTTAARETWCVFALTADETLLRCGPLGMVG
jgi:hypothetical protein